MSYVPGPQSRSLPHFRVRLPCLQGLPRSDQSSCRSPDLMPIRGYADVRRVGRMNDGSSREPHTCHETAHQSPCRHLPRASTPGSVQSSDDRVGFPAADVRRGRRALAPCARGGLLDARSGAAVGRVASIVFLGVVPVVAVIFMFQIGWSSDSLAVDFHNEIYPEAKQLLDGTNPFPGPDADLSHGSNFIWPPFVGYVVAPLTLLPAGGGRHPAAIAQPDRVRRRPVDRRCPRLARLRRLVPVAPGDRRDANGPPDARPLPPPRRGVADARPVPVPGLALGVALGLKFFLWPLVVASRSSSSSGRSCSGSPRCGGGATQRSPRCFAARHAPARCCPSSRCPSTHGSCAGSGDLRPGQLHAVRPARPGWARPIASRRSSRSRSASRVLAIAWRRRSFVLFVAAALMLSPIVWLDYYARARRPARRRPAAAVGDRGCCPSSPGASRRPATASGSVGTSLRTLSVFACAHGPGRPRRSGDRRRSACRAPCDARRCSSLSASQACPRQQRR